MPRGRLPTPVIRCDPQEFNPGSVCAAKLPQKISIQPCTVIPSLGGGGMGPFV